MTTLTDTQVITASGGLVELGHQTTDRTNVAVSGTSTSNATELVSTSVVCDGSPILVEFQCGVSVTNGEYLSFGVWVDGTYNVTLEGTMASPGRNPFSTWARITPAAGARTISIRWWRWSGSTFTSYIEGNCRVRVSKIVQATQWPAVTTGTIICTSSTRPASPFEGQTIYETDTDLSKIYNGAAWVSPQYQSKPPALSYYWSNVSTTGFSQFVVSGTPTTTQYDSGDISYNASTGVFTLPKNGLYMASFYASPVSGSGYFPVTISVDAASGATQTPTYIGNSYSGAGWAGYTTMNASGIFAANGDRQIRFRIYTSATSGFEAFVRLAWISST